MTKPAGRHPHKRLTAVTVRNGKRAGRFADGNGLYLFVEPSGAKRWILRTVAKGRRQDIGLGSARLVPLADAREEAARLRRIARAGGDPLAERRRETLVVPTFKEAAKQVHASHAATFKNLKHRAQWLASLETDVFPVFGDRPVNAIESGDVLKALSPIWTTKPETARRLKQRIKVVFDWAKASGYRSGDNPADGISKVLPKGRPPTVHHSALPYAHVPAFLTLLRESDAGESTKLAFEFLVLTAARTSEVTGARWEELDRNAKTWTIPAVRIKSGREHRVPLSVRCLGLFDLAKAIADGGPFVFPGRNDTAPLSNMAFLTRRSEPEQIKLSTLVEHLNERFGTNFRPADQLFFDQVEANAVEREDIQQAAKANSIDNFKLLFEKEMEGLFVDRMEGNDDIFRRVMQDEQFRAVASAYLMNKVYEKARTARK